MILFTFLLLFFGILPAFHIDMRNTMFVFSLIFLSQITTNWAWGQTSSEDEKTLEKNNREKSAIYRVIKAEGIFEGAEVPLKDCSVELYQRSTFWLSEEEKRFRNQTPLTSRPSEEITLIKTYSTDQNGFARIKAYPEQKSNHYYNSYFLKICGIIFKDADFSSQSTKGSSYDRYLIPTRIKIEKVDHQNAYHISPLRKNLVQFLENTSNDAPLSGTVLFAK